MYAIDLSGQSALVTGASRGIGAVIARRLAEAGAAVAINYRSSGAEAEAVVDGIRNAGGQAIPVPGDVSDEHAAEAVVKGTVEQLGRLDILVNNAGVNRDRLLMRMTTEDWDQVLTVNLRGTFLPTRHAVPLMVRQRYGRIVNISSVVGLSGNPGQANYAASKAGQIGLAKAVAREVASRNITVNSVAPGFIEFSDSGGMTADLTDDQRGQILSRIPAGRFGSADDVASAVLYLVSSGASYMTGQTLTVDGGLIA
ncbi:3-oxoacyl-[acyl-carrier-protein] reductase FabG [Geodia barretti]|uniref:3-oxoacyl-[acyl-carrier-protein] reductase n=1 Tax=Geodia barretti TaxID=519541 RepID=A0AA35XGZ3_GEOBA|nr:3-oxoacyl-[acyl-carrier-protein] reductase FabG [Geodia barretti]